MFECFDALPAFDVQGMSGVGVAEGGGLVGQGQSQLLEILIGSYFRTALKGLYLFAGSEIEHNEVANIGEHNPFQSFFDNWYSQQFCYLFLFVLPEIESKQNWFFYCEDLFVYAYCFYFGAAEEENWDYQGD